MSKTFRAWEVDQVWLLPPSIQDLVPAGHLSHFVRETVREGLDLREIMSSYKEDRGYPPYHPGMMVALLLYAYSQGVYSSRRIARGCEERLDFGAVTGLQYPDFRTISDFRKRHLKALSGLFLQVLKLCQSAGLVKLGHVALDGTRMKANASKHKAMSYARMKQAEKTLAAEVEGWLSQAAQADAAEDRQLGADKRGDELPDWVANKQARLDKIRAAKAALEAEAAATASDGSNSGDGRSPPTVPDDRQRNFTDAESRIIKTKDGFIQGYNAQAAVDSHAQIIVAQGLTNQGNDQAQLVPMVKAVRINTGRNPDELSADAGYCSATNLRDLARRRIKAYVATGRQRHGTAAAVADRKYRPGIVARMATKLKRGGHRSRYRLRKHVVEPVFGHIKQARGFRQFLLRGIDKVSAEWAMLCTVHNLLKLAKACPG